MTTTQEPLTFDKVWQMFQETDRRFKETDKKLNQLEYLFTSQWGKLIETLVEGDLIRLLQNRGIDVNVTYTNVNAKYNKSRYEFDIIALNGTEVVVVEVKTTLGVKYVNQFIERLSIFKNIFPDYQNKKLYGAVAFLKAHSQSDKYAESKGMFTIRATGNSASITNEANFKPKEF